VDPVFREYYGHLGGEEMFGPAISAPMYDAGRVEQYLEAAKLVFDPEAPASMRFQLAPLGLEMEVFEPPSPPPADPSERYENGHTIFPDFYPMYERLGAHTVGMPLTEGHLNLIRNRYEQFFENVGFYRPVGSSEVHLLAYGAWVCDQQCRDADGVKDATIDIESTVEPTFKDFVDGVGSDFTGFALTKGYNSDDGKLEQILENVVLMADSAENSESVGLRALSEKVSILPEEPRPQGDSLDVFFFPTDGDLGYEVPLHFWEYYLGHGGLKVFGKPITHYSVLINQVYHQCFENLCLTYDPGASEGARVRPEPLGYAYKILYYDERSQQVPIPQATTAPSSELAPINPTQASTEEPPLEQPQVEREIVLQVWERFMVLETKGGQEITLQIIENENPQIGVDAELVVIFPDGSERAFNMPPTDDNGLSMFLLPEIEAENGSTIPYRVCVRVSENQKFCVAEFFVIWNNP
jgi:hypothetical protein